MFELLFIGFILFGGFILGLKILFMFLGLLFSGLGFIFRFLIIGGLAAAVFPAISAAMGAMVSSGFLMTVLIIAFAVILLDGIRKNRRYQDRESYDSRGYYR